jgi:hypothetical protein
LAQGLKNDGHTVRIATHAEFGDWIRGHGLEFRPLAGDPAQLLVRCLARPHCTPHSLMRPCGRACVMVYVGVCVCGGTQEMMTQHTMFSPNFLRRAYGGVCTQQPGRPSCDRSQCVCACVGVWAGLTVCAVV